MKAKVKETGEIIEVQMLYPVTYSRLDGNHKIIEEYDEDELELIIPPKPKMIPLNKACEWLKEHCIMYVTPSIKSGIPFTTIDGDKMINDFRKAMED